MKVRLIAKGFNYSQDGPGNRLVYHLSGCNMTCPWCSNPEGMNAGGVKMTEKDGRTRMSYTESDADEIIEEAISSTPVFIDGGGVTFSGGEPTLQYDALLYILKALHENGIHTAIETNATSNKLSGILPYLDLIIADFKHPDSALHKKFTGLNNENIIENLKMLSHCGKPVIIRTPLINGVNSSGECRDSFIRTYLDGFELKNVSFELLPYHEYGVEKWKKCGMDYKIKDGSITDEIRTGFEEAYKKAGLNVIRT